MPYSSQWAAERATRAELEGLEETLLIEFGAGGCPHCQAVQPLLKEILSDRADVSHLKIEDGKGRPLGRSYGVKLWPNFVLLRDGEFVEQLARPSETELRNALAKL